MLHSLLTRFQGGLLGSAIAEIAVNPNTDGQEPSLSSRQLSLLTTLLQPAHLEAREWQETHQKQRTSSNCNWTPNSSELAVLTLPLVLFYHDSTSHLEAQLDNFLHAWELTPESRAEILLWGQIIALALRGKLQPRHWLCQLPAVPAHLKLPLEQLQDCLAQNLPLAECIAEFKHESPQFQGIAAALYCFASTPEDFRLSTLRALQVERQMNWQKPNSKIILAGAAALTGALAGAYNSISGIPAPWRLAVQKTPALQEIPQQAAALLAAWSGNYCYLTGDASTKLAVAAAGTIQPRRSWQMISQR